MLGRQAQPRAQPAADLGDGLVDFRHPAGADDERVLTVRHRARQHLVACRLGAPGEFLVLTGEQLREYITAEHSYDAAGGCVMPALSADVSRAKPPVKDAYQRKMTALIDRVAGLLDGEESDRRRRAWSVVALMVGSIVISRGLPEQSETRTAPLDSALGTAVALIDGDDRQREQTY